MILVVMGVAGCGKSTLAQAVARSRGWAMLEADDLHPAANVAAMRAGRPLTDAEREPWLEAVGGALRRWRTEGRDGVAACSALKRAYRDRLRAAAGAPLAFAYLALDPQEAARRVAARPGHYAPPALVPSQFAALEPPQADELALTLNAGLPPSELLYRLDRFVVALAQPWP